jgi:hypothetical protein
MTKKEREEKKAQGKTIEEVVSIVVHYPFLESSSSSTKPSSFQSLSSLKPLCYDIIIQLPLLFTYSSVKVTELVFEILNF